MIDLLAEWGWRQEYDPDFDVIRDFTVPFVKAANGIRVYGSPACVAAMDEIQEALDILNKAAGNSEHETAAHKAIEAGHDHFVVAAREDVGPQKADRLKDVPFHQGGGPRTAAKRAPGRARRDKARLKPN